MSMTKEQFILEIEGLGFESYKDLVAKLGYNRRYLDRFKYEDTISEKIVEQFEKWKQNNGPLKTEEVVDKKEVTTQKSLPKKEDSKPKEKKIEVKIEKSKPKEPKSEPKIEISKPKAQTIGIDIPNEVYHSSTKLGSSKIKLILENAREYEAKYITKELGQKKTDALLIGSMHHTLVLEPQKFNEEYIVLNIPARPVKQDYVEAVEMLGGTLETRENSKKEIVVADTVDTLKEKLDVLKTKVEKTIVTQSQLDIAMTTSEKALESMFVVEVGNRTLLKAKLKEVLELDNCYVEKTFYGIIDGVEVQVRPDALVNLSKDHQIWFCIDLKTAVDATPSMFAQQSAKFYYDIQQYVYVEILRQNGIEIKDFRFNVSGKSEASRSAYYQLHNEDMESAGKVVSAVLKKYKWCLENNIWEEGKFDYHKMRFDTTTVVKMPTWRAFQLIDIGVL